MGEIEEYVPRPTLAAPPAAFDSATNWPACAKTIGDIRDQSNCGCCWAFGGAEAASDRMCIASGASLLLPLSAQVLPPLPSWWCAPSPHGGVPPPLMVVYPLFVSAQDVCFNAGGLLSSGCNGGQISAPWEYIKRTGAVTGGQYHDSGPFAADGPFCSQFSLPHCHHHGPQGKDPFPAEGQPGCPSESSPKGPKACDADAAAAHADFAADKYSFRGAIQSAAGVAAIKAMLMEGGPVATAFTVYSDFENYAGGVYTHTAGAAVGGHAVKIVGWGTDGGTEYWKVCAGPSSPHSGVPPPHSGAPPRPGTGYWKVANSWNPYWGEGGYFRIAFGEGGIDDRVVGSSASATWSKKA